MAGRASDLIDIPDVFWHRLPVLDALRARDIGAAFRLLRQYTGASQTQIAIACHMTQGNVSQTMKPGGRQINALEVFERIADGLDMPDDARMTLGLAPRSFAAPPESGAVTAPAADQFSGFAFHAGLGFLGGEQGTSAEGDAVRRRTFTKLAGTSMFNAVLADLPGDASPFHGVEAFAGVLIDCDGMREKVHSAVRALDQLRDAVAAAKRDYQDCRYSTVIASLPGLLADLQVAGTARSGDEQVKVEALSAEAHHVAASILLKFDRKGLAWLAADRSMRAARRTQDPTVVGSSARIVTHALMNDGHFGAATRTASTYAERIDRDSDDRTPEFLSVYGSLLLRGAVAAGQRGDHHTAAALLDEADDAGRQLGGDFNHRWTAFGPTNVQLHRVNIALQLGDAGTALRHARTIDLDRIALTERKATLIMDTARALAQCGKHEKAYEMLRFAHQLAPEEVARPSARRVMRDLMATAPPSVRRCLNEFVDDIGIAL
ncbi:helix-turn-helix domain-containing protein [Actinomadura atramentaria]|uniref:helix-turn-helix domain-containing protein n=1 Tax=Actinomadura atramentaria TaxID=1990 RepID=UPI000382E491|nr:helix-turn-helix domain-containing protein [Actinomadura atramentaria]